jgi:hypothetical protein
MKAAIFLILLFQVSSLFAYSGNSLTWQKLALEEKVQRKFNVILSSLLKENQYLVEIEAEMSEPPAPNFGDDGPKTGPRVSDLSMAESRGDYIAFSKMGLEVPVVEKFLDEDRTKLMNLYRFNETYDLFKNLTGLKVNVFLSDKLPTDLVEIVKKVLQSSKVSVSGVKPVVKFESIALEWIDPADLKKAEDANKKTPDEKKAEQAEPKIWAKDWYEWASRWGNAVGLILGSLIIGFIAISLFKQWQALMEKLAAMTAAKDKPEDKEEDDKNDVMTMAANSPKQEEDVATSHGFERFQQCLEQHADDAVNMVRSWLNEGDEFSLLALRGVAQQALAPEMDKLMQGLTEQQRDKWKGLLGKHLEAQDLAAANKHIFQEVIRSFLVPSRIKDGELLNLIMELNAKTTCEFIKANELQTGILMNLLSPSVVGRILAEVDDETADLWLMHGSEFDVKTMDDMVPALKEALVAYKEANAPAPFAQRIMTMIPSASPAREGTLFRALAKSGNAGMVMEVAKKHFPSELVLDLPAPFLKEVMQTYPMFKRVEFLHSRSEEVRSNLLNILAETGTPARDMIDMELDNITRDPSRGATIETRTEEIWQEFVKMSRVTLSKNVSYSGLTDQLIQEWSSKLGSGLQAIRGGRAA